jgi:hypothetical protein
MIDQPRGLVVNGSIPGSTMGIFSLIGEDPHGDHGLGS